MQYPKKPWCPTASGPVRKPACFSSRLCWPTIPCTADDTLHQLNRQESTDRWQLTGCLPVRIVFLFTSDFGLDVWARRWKFEAQCCDKVERPKCGRKEKVRGLWSSRGFEPSHLTYIFINSGFLDFFFSFSEFLLYFIVSKGILCSSVHVNVSFPRPHSTL